MVNKLPESTIITSSKNSLIITCEDTDDILSRKANDNRRLFSTMSNKVSSKESRIQKETLVKEFPRFSLWSTADKWTQYGRPKEIASSMEANILNQIDTLLRVSCILCTYFIEVHDTRSWPIAFVEYAKHMIDIWH